MTNYLKFTEAELKKAEKVLMDAGITFQGNVDIGSEVIHREVDYYFDENPEEIKELHEAQFPEMDFDTFESFLRDEVLYNIVNNDTGFISGTEAIETEIFDVVKTEYFIGECREMSKDNVI